MHILILSWRDPKHPHSGGAETLTHEIAKRWVREGHAVIWFTSSFPAAPAREKRDGIVFVRRGTWWNVHILAPWYYVTRFRSVDVVIDEVHWFPFFSIFYAPRKTILLACEVAGPLFSVLFPWPVAQTGRLLERAYLFLYKNIPTLAISASTKRALLAEGFSSKNVKVLPMGISVPKQLPELAKNKQPTMLYLGRIHALKGSDDAIEAFGLVQQRLPHARLWVVGGGSPGDRERLEHTIKNLGLSQSVNYYGYVTESQKFKLLRRAHVLVVPSVQEGWGLVVSEAGVVGTPAVVYDVPGLRDVVADKKSGYVVMPNPSDMARAVIHLMTSPAVYKKMQIEARARALRYSWGDTAKAALEFFAV